MNIQFKSSFQITNFRFTHLRKQHNLYYRISLFGYPVWQTIGTQSCRQQECTDIYLGISNDQCIGKINKKQCVSNGANCVSQGTCASYKNKVSCAGGGSDSNNCIFTAAPTTTDQLAGTCVPFTSCQSANGDSATCILNPSCKYFDTTKECKNVDCGSFNSNGKCEPFPSFDGKTYTLCVSSATGCQAGDPSSIAQTDCYSTVSRYSYTWNQIYLSVKVAKVQLPKIIQQIPMASR